MILGKHLLLDIEGEIDSTPFCDMDSAEKAFIDIAKNAGATVLSSHWHHFGEGCGYTGVIILAESHISCHTWRERGFAAVDIFMCGEADPELTVAPILTFFNFKNFKIKEYERGHILD